MRSLTRLIVVAIIIFLPFVTIAQNQFFLPDSSIKVYAYGKQQTIAWCGGFNNPQFATGDLNHDGLDDLVVFESYNSIRTFINVGTIGNPNYMYAPDYALNFPEVYDYLILADYNRDGIPDLFQQGEFGFAVYKGYYNAQNQLCFNFYENLFYDNDVNADGWANAFNNPGDIPAVVDVDGDGDLDFISYDILGGWMNYYRNMQVEYGLPADSIHIDLWSECWGDVYQGFWRGHYLQRTCDNSSLILDPGTGGMETARGHGGIQRTTHSGNTPCLFDWDMDGDMDYLDGSISFNQMTFLENGRIPYNPTGADSMFYQDSMWQSQVGGTQINLQVWPAAFNVDIDQDGKKDLLIAPNYGTTCMNYNNIWYYKNNTTPGNPDWEFQSDSFLIDHAIDLGSAAMPVLFDYNKDGLLDLFVGSDGYRQTDGTLRSRISYYQNTGTPGNPSFTLQTTDFLGTNTFDWQGTAPTIGDIDNDGISDLVIGHTDGTLTYYKNMAASDSVTPNWQLQEMELTDINGDTINVGGYAAPFIYDIDKDGKPDLLIGSLYGTITYYRNVSTTPGVIRLQLYNTNLGGVVVEPTLNFGNYSTIYIGKIDTTGVDYLLMGSNSGLIYEYTGFQSGDTTATYTLVTADFSYIDTVHGLYYDDNVDTAGYTGGFAGIYDGLRSAPVVGDIIGDGSLEMLVGENKGGIELYKLKTYVPEAVPTVSNEQGKILVYPNPTSETLNVSWQGIYQQTVQINVINMAGQILYRSTVDAALQHTSISVSMLPPGMYVCELQSGVNRYYNKFTVIPKS